MLNKINKFQAIFFFFKGVFSKFVLFRFGKQLFDPFCLTVFSLQSLNMSLQNQLEESLKSQELLQSKNEELLKVIENQKDENKKFTSIFKDKDQTILENKQQYDIEITRIKIGMYLDNSYCHIF